jgi:tetratricopeptide (TPR) repeat protein
MVISTRLRIAEAHRRARNSEVAIQILEELVRQHPDRSDVKNSQLKTIVKYGEDLLRSSQPEEGRRYLRKAIELSDDDQIRLQLIASHQDQTLQIREAIKIATVLYRNSKKERALCLINSLEALHPENIEMQRARIEFMLDHGEEQISEIALERLAAQLAKEGSLEEARDIAESVRRLRHKRKSHSLDSHRGTRALKRIRLLVLLLPFLIFTILVIETEFALQKVIAKAELMTPDSWRREASPWLRWIPPGPWKTGLEDAAALVEERSSDRQRTYSTAAKEALQNAKNSRILGNVEDLSVHLQQATKFGAGTEVKLLTKKWLLEDQQAMDLRQKISTSRNQGDLPGARRWTIEILKLYPANDASVGLTIPVEIVSKPGTALIDEAGKSISLPTWIEVEPFGSKKIVLEKEGRRTEFVISTQSPETVTLPAP